MEEPRRRTETVAFFKLFITTDAGVRLVSLQLSLIGRARAQTGILLAVCLQHFLRVFFLMILLNAYAHLSVQQR